MLIRRDPKRCSPIHQVVQAELRSLSPDFQPGGIGDPLHVVEALLGSYNLSMQPSWAQIRYRTEVIPVHPVMRQRFGNSHHISQKWSGSHTAGVGGVATRMIQGKYAIQEPACIEVSGSRRGGIE